MNKKDMNKDLLSTSSHVVLHFQMPQLTKQSYQNILVKTQGWVKAQMEMWQRKHQEMLDDRTRSKN